MTAAQIVEELTTLGTEPYRRILRKHGARDPLLGVKISDMQPIRKRVKKDYRLALDLYDTGIYDAQYLAGLIADETRMTKKDLKHWLAKANCMAICGSAVSWVAAESDHGMDLAREWIESKKEATATCGWTTLSSLVSITPDEELPIEELASLLERTAKTIHAQPNRVRYAMNGFVISLGSYVAELTDAAIAAAQRIGTVSVDMGDTACETPFAPDYIRKVQQRGTIGKKRKTARC
jgi:3-methyladenine DNA glycosylase AlkD